MQKIRNFIKNEDGNYAAMFALAALPLFGAVGLSVDYSNVSRLKYELKDAADAACVPMSKLYLKGEKSDTDVIEYGKNFFKANFDPSYVADSNFEVMLPSAQGNASKQMYCKGTVTYRTLFGPVLAYLTKTDANNYIVIVQESTMKMKNVAEVALVLDNSGSMAEYTQSGGKRIDLIKTATKQLVHDLVTEGVKITNQANAVKFSVVPFAASVNVGPDNRNAPWMDQRGISPIHHENLSWGVMNTPTTPWKSIAADGAKLDASANPLTRFSILDNLRFADGGTEVSGMAGCRVWAYNTGTGTNITTASNYDTACAVKDRVGTTTPITYLYPSKAADRATLATKMGTTAAALEAKYTWKGCVEARPYPYNIQDDEPSSSSPAAYVVPMLALDDYNNDRYGGTKSSSTSVGDSGSANNWWPDSITPTSMTIGAAFNYYTSASSPTAAWKTTTGRGRMVDVTKYFNETPYLLGSTTSSTSTSSGDQRKGQWHYFKADAGVNVSCTVPPLTPLVGSESTITTAIDAMQANGNTNVTEGLAWGWHTVSHGEPFSEGVADTDKSVDKVIIVFTDGINTYSSQSGNSDYANQQSTYAAYGYTGWANNGGSGVLGTQTSSTNVPRIFKGTTISAPSSDYSSAMIQHMDQLCTNIKSTDRILLMTVGLDLDPAANADGPMITALSQCAGDSRSRKDSSGAPKKMFWNACTQPTPSGSCTTLDDTMKQIKDELSNLRFVG